MKCEFCSGELFDTGIDLSQEEILDLEFASTKETTARQALRPDVFLAMNLTEPQMYSYIKANTDSLAEALFLLNRWKKTVAEAYNLKQDFVVRGLRIYCHVVHKEVEDGYSG